MTENENSYSYPNQSREVIAAMRSRAYSHRKFAVSYTIAVFITILVAIGAYYLFQQSKLDRFENSNRKLNSEYSAILTEMQKSTEDLKTSILSTRTILQLHGDSLQRQEKLSATISGNILKKIDDLDAKIDFASVTTFSSQLDSVNRRLNEFIITAKKRHSDLSFFFDEFRHRNNLFNNERDTLVFSRFKTTIDTLILQFYGVKLNKNSFLKLRYSNASTVDYLTRCKSNLDDINRTANLLEKRLANIAAIDRKLKKGYELDSAIVQKLKSSSYDLDANYAKFQNGMIKMRSRLDGNVSLISSLNQSFYQLRVDAKQIESSPANILNRINTTLEVGLVKTDSIKKRFIAFSRATKDNEEKKVDFYDDLPRLLARYGLIIFLIYVIQLLLSYAKYHYRLASFYDSKGDALMLFSDIDSLNKEELIKLLDSSQVSFGRTDNIYKRLYEFVKDFQSKQGRTTS
jgi:hypothetical protein